MIHMFERRETAALKRSFSPVAIRFLVISLLFVGLLFAGMIAGSGTSTAHTAQASTAAVNVKTVSAKKSTKKKAKKKLSKKAKKKKLSKKAKKKKLSKKAKRKKQQQALTRQTRNLRSTERIGASRNADSKRSAWLKRNPTVKLGSIRHYALKETKKAWPKSWKKQWKCVDRMWWHESEWRGKNIPQVFYKDSWVMKKYLKKHKKGTQKHYVDVAIWYLKYAHNGNPSKPKYGTACSAWSQWKQRARTGYAGWY